MIKLIRLTSGEEIIAEVTEAGAGGYYIEDVSIILPTESGIGLADLMPYSKMSEQKTFVKESAILFITEPVDGLAAQYLQIHSKIFTPPRPKIIT
jgi:hypothetical protein